MASHRRFEDEQYKNWLKTTMSLQLLRTSLGDFLENETETFHNSLKNKLKQATCKNGCTVKANYRNKVPEVCPECKPWGEEIFKNHNNKRGEIYWNNSKPCLWSSRKWEVAKVYMPRGNKDHHAVDQFDISAILNLMNVCSHFKNFVKEQIIKEVTYVRNQMMHSADMKVAKEDMQKHLSKILDFVKHLQDRVPHLNNLKDEISQLEEAELNIMVEGQDTSQKDAAMNLMNKQQMLDLEQQVLKEKIEALASRLEEDKDLNNEELQRMKEFLDQNKDLLEQLGPHMEKFNAIQVKVEQHDQQLTDLTETVDQLVKKTEEPAFSADTVKYKNHLFEEAKENKWPDPMFNVLPKSQGYIGQVVVNGQTFTGCLDHPNKTAAHQEVSKIALEQLHLQSKEEGSLSLHEDDQSAAANSLFFAEVKVPVKTEFKGPEAGSSEAAVLEAYKSLAQALNLGDAGAGCPSDDARERVCDFFRRARCDPPKECVSTTDGKFMCTLCIDGNLTFQNPEGMSKKRQAEIAAAKEALLRLARVLDWDLAGVKENYKGRLQEMLVKQGQELPSYQPVFEPVHTEPSHRGAESEKSLASVPIPQAAVSVSNMESQARASVDSSQFPLQVQMPKTEDPAPVVATVQPSESNLTQRSDTDVPVVHHNTAVGQAIIPAMPIHTSETSVPSANSLVFVGVTVPVKTEFKGPEAGSSEAAFLEAYKSLAQALNLGDAGAGCPSDDSRERVCDFFSRACCDPPKECVSTTDGKFMCTLCIDGNLTFQNPEGMSKKRQAENAAAKEALHRLARVLDWDLAGVNENYKGRLQEILVKQGQELPSYQPVFEPVHTEPSHRGAESEKSLASVPIPQAAVSVSNMESQARASVDSSQFPLQVQMPKTEAPAPVMPTVQPSESNFTQRSDSDVPVVHHNTAAGQAIIPAMPIHTSESSVPSANSLVFMGVTVPVKTEFKGPEAGSSEAAVLEAYKSLAQALNLGDAGAGCPSDDARERVCDFFSRARCDPPKECVSTTDGKFMCTLCIDGNMTFQNPEGMSKKRQAEIAAAKEALHRLARVLDWDLAGVKENYKGRLQEILVKQGQEPPSYQPVIEPVHTEPSYRGAESEKSLASVPIPQVAVSVSNMESQATASVDSSQFPLQVQIPKNETPAPVVATVQPSESNLTQRSDTDVPVVHHNTAVGQAIIPAMPIHTSETSVPSASSLVFVGVTVPVKTEFKGPEAGSSEAAVLEAYKSLALALNLGDAGAEGMSKKKQAENAAAKEALHRLARVLDWDLTGVKENYKGRLQEILVKQGQELPSYQPVFEPVHTEPSHRGAESEKSLASVPIPQAAVSVSNMESQARASVDSSQFPLQVQMPKTEAPAPVMPTVQPSESNFTQRSDSDVPVVHHNTAAGQAIIPAMPIHTSESSVPSANSLVFMGVTVPVKTEFKGPEAGSSEAAVLEAYKSLAQALNLGDAGAGCPSDDARERVCDFFSRARCDPPKECVSITDGKFMCTLCIDGNLTFQNPEGMSKKKQAENAAAKEALHRLARVLDWDLEGVTENHKGRLQEILVKQGQEPPSYQPVIEPVHTEPSHRGAESEKRKSPDDHTQHLPDVKKPKRESPDFGRVLRMFGLQPTSVSCENFNVKEWYILTVEINLVNFTYTNQQGCNNKKEAIRKAYLIFGQATGICQPCTEEIQASMAVKQHFSQNSFSLPTEEVVEKEQKKFYCSLKVESCRLSFEGQGESEEAARLEACKQALSQLGQLFDYKSPSSSDTASEERLTFLLEDAGQGPPAFRKADVRYTADAQLNLNDFALECKGQSSKKLAQRQLCAQILVLLGQKETETCSERNQVDDWFKQKQLPQPVFADTKGSGPGKKAVFGMKATFSALITFTHPDRKASEEEAVTALLGELKRRLKAC
ncbi:hypothetical protein COCON_G00200340 [Conger conger]|uniref:DRBM domain-containing protein n=1 Tax=Conger conger TaxID=82655 RepID=A0A9Q1D248_CONCO|nr:hypothetical protein COCON_G00200340 [Conger conger]